MSGFANTAKPLTKFQEKKEAFQWTPEVTTSFQTLKEASSTALSLLTTKQEKGSPLTQTRVTSGSEESGHKYRTRGSE
jgi:hypothetical protein